MDKLFLLKLETIGNIGSVFLLAVLACGSEYKLTLVNGLHDVLVSNGVCGGPATAAGPGGHSIGKRGE